MMNIKLSTVVLGERHCCC